VCRHSFLCIVSEVICTYRFLCVCRRSLLHGVFEGQIYVCICTYIYGGVPLFILNLKVMFMYVYICMYRFLCV